MPRYHVGDKVLYLDPNRVYEVKSVDSSDTYTIELKDTNITLTIGGVPDAEIRPESYQKGEKVEYLDPAQVYEVKGVAPNHTYTIERAKASKPSQIGPVPDGLIRPH